MMTSLNTKILNTAMADVGTWEWAGAEHNPKVLAYFDDAGHPHIDNDEVPWCAAFAGSVLKRCGVEPTGSLLARSYLNWGEVVALEDAQPGDVVVIPRGSKSWQGHVFFIADFPQAGTVRGVGGNQGNQVNVKQFAFTKATVLGVRRAKASRERISQSTTMQATGAGAVATVGAAGTAVSQMDGTAQLVVVVGAIVVLLAFLWIARERIQKWARGIR